MPTSVASRHARFALPLLLLLGCAPTSPAPSPEASPAPSSEEEPSGPAPRPSGALDASVPARRDAGKVDAGKVDAGKRTGAARPVTPSDYGAGSTVSPTRPAGDDAVFRALTEKLAKTQKLDPASARAAYPVKFASELGYDPNAAEFLDKIAGSGVGLSDGERSALAKNGFVISQRREFPTFVRGLSEIYAEHLPLYVTADALLESVHSSYDLILETIERSLLVPDLRALLSGMRTRLALLDMSEPAHGDADLYLTVAASLLDDRLAEPALAENRAQVAKLFALAKAEEGVEEIFLFGVKRDEDFSQFKPRGHYASDFQLSAYFRAQMWLGRTDLRLLETQPDGSQVFRRNQYLAMLLLTTLVGPDQARFERLDNTIRTFVGESDYMVVSEVAKLVADLGGEALARQASDAAVAQAIVSGGYGKQQIASHVMTNGGEVDTLPLSRSFALLGQRYVVDSHVFSELVYDRLKNKRMMPSPLDAAFAALGNAQALALHPELASHDDLPGALVRTRMLVDAHDETFWDKNFYNLWLSALRTLSPAADLTSTDLSGLPALATTEPWGRRLLNTQLGSWAELRHDTLLYAKQSYTGVPACGFPDVYVEPYPAFYRALGKYAAAGSRMAEQLSEEKPELAQRITDYFALLTSATALLGDMAERELRGEPFSEAQLAFINDAVRVERQPAGCASIDVPDGWYARLFFDPQKSIEFEPTMADVHTQPADEGGNLVGRVLHVGTSYPRLLVTTVDTCQGPRAYAGVVFAYHELVTNDFERLTDQDWARRLIVGPRPDEVSWLHDVLAK